MRSCLAAMLVLVLICPAAVLAFDHQHRLWTEQLQQHVVLVRDGLTSQVDYASWKQDRSGLETYLGQLQAVTVAEYRQWTRPQQLAFLINAYNAFTVALVLNHYPGIDSIKQIGSWFSSPWRQKFFVLLGESRSLDDVEHRLIRGPQGFDEPRIHFALVCASVSCPPLLHESYRGEVLDLQLEQAVTRFLSDPQRNRYNQAARRLDVSSLFKWYGGDFIGFRGNVNVADFFRPYAALLAAHESGRQAIRSARLPVTYLPYDWRLNDWRE
ncbi:MAG: DUF547 domain-containing protein [Desulfuromonas sp.]|nr:MAG: DUF547 domain-containing protein [Desulfuromonas sp.]